MVWNIDDDSKINWPEAARVDLKQARADYAALQKAYAAVAALVGAPHAPHGAVLGRIAQVTTEAEHYKCEVADALDLLRKVPEVDVDKDPTAPKSLRFAVLTLVEEFARVLRSLKEERRLTPGEFAADSVRRELCNVLDRLGADGVTSFLNKVPVDKLHDEIHSHVVWLEERASLKKSDRVAVVTSSPSAPNARKFDDVDKILARLAQVEARVSSLEARAVFLPGNGS